MRRHDHNMEIARAGPPGPPRYLVHDRDCLVSYARFALCEVVVDGNWRSFSLNRFLSRVALFTHEPLCFAICRRTTHGRYRLIFSSVDDPLYRQIFINSCHSVLTLLSNKTLDDISILVSLFHTQYSMMLFTVAQLRNRLATSNHYHEYRVLDNNNPIWQFFSDVFQPIGSALSTIGIREHIDKRLVSDMRVSFVRMRAKDDHPKERFPKRGDGDDAWQDSTDKIVAAARDTVVQLIDDEYQKLSNSPLLSPNGKWPANILFFMKSFNRDSVRFGTYYYDCNLVIGPSQREHIILGLHNLKRSATNFPYPYSDRNYDKLFWELISTNDGPQQIIDIITSNLGPDTRLFTEYCITSGTAYVIRDPFRADGIGRIASHPNEPRLVRDEKLRLACLHYVMLLPALDYKNPSLLMLPIRVSGAPWLMAVTVRDRAVETDGDTPGLLVNDEWFQRSYLFYHSIMRPFERRIRRRSKAEYMKHASKIISRYMKMCAVVYAQGGTLQASDVVAKLNAELVDLCRVYTFDNICFIADTNKIRDLQREDEKRKQGQRIIMVQPSPSAMWFQLKENPFFDRLRLQRFISLEEARDQIVHNVRANWVVKEGKGTRRVSIAQRQQKIVELGE
jgi:hypothetical protein